jgi:hypothetical protein
VRKHEGERRPWFHGYICLSKLIKL